ncbi:MAG TPA: YihY/virulence factor BrkB family protein [Actinomycetota bacterium]|nr:YihY/virulence factor BrkB family protein [Actinomycetota bacterium]
MERLRAAARRLDRFQRRHPVVAFPLAVAKRFGEDQGGYLAALVAYYGFFSLFPLLLVFVTVLGLALAGNPALREAALETALGRFPVIGDEIRENVGSLRGGVLALAVGVGGALWAGTGVTLALQHALNRIWGVPPERRPGGIGARARGLLLLAVLGSLTLASTFVSGLVGSGAAPALLLRAGGLAGSALLNLVLFSLAYRVLTAAPLGWRDVLPGAAVAALGWTGLQAVGGFVVARQISGASDVYGTFALVIGLLVWITLGAQLTLYGAEVNVVRARRLWPRSLLSPPEVAGAGPGPALLTG